MKGLLKIAFVNVAVLVLLVSVVNILSVSATYLYERFLKGSDVWQELPSYVGGRPDRRD